MNSRLPKTSISALLLSAALIIATALPLQGQATSYVPALQARDGADLGLALVNPTLSEAKVTLTARDYTGAIIQNNAITNPVTLAVPASGQIAMRAAELFGSGISGQAGWVEVSASTPAVKGLFSVFGSGLSFIDVGEFATPASRLIFPKVSGSLATELSLVNVGRQPVQVTLSLYTNDGQVFSAKSMSIPAFSGFTSSLDELVPSATNFEGYAVMDSGVSPGPGMSESLVGFETYRNRSDIALVRAFPESARLRTGFLAHLVSQGGYSSKLTLVNFSGDSQIVRITADGLQVGGSPRTPPSATVERTLPPNARLEETVEQMFNLSGEALIDGYIRFETETNTPGVIGFLDYGTTDGVALSAVEAQGEGYSNLFFSEVVEGAGFYTGLALVNPNSEPAIVTLDIFDTGGNRTGSTIVNLDSGEREAGLLSEFLRTDITQFGGYIRLTATRPIFALELFGPRNPSTFLASAPAQGESLKPQISGREVDASLGANVISNDGSISLLIPSTALKANSSINVEPISVTGLPLASGSGRPISAVEATPAGTQFQIPVRLTFPLNAHLDSGTKIPLLIFDPQTRTYQTTEFVATVDKSGRTASAEVTHFTQYVASISGSLLTISVTPSTVSVGDTITITGDSFCTSRPQTSVTFAANSTSVQGTVLSISPTSIQAQVPDGAVTGPVTVRSCKQTSTGYVITVASPNPAPGTISITPSSVTAGTTSVTLQIAGTNLMAQSVVYYDSAPIADTFVDSTRLKVTVSATAGIHHLYVVNPTPGGGTSNTVDFTVTAATVPPASSGPLSILTALQLDKTTLSAGQTLNATVTYKNTSASAVTVNTIVIAGRPPGGTNDGGPYLDLTPATGATTIQPGATLQVSASRAFASTDSTGKWYAFPTYQDTSLVWYDGSSVTFTVGSAPAPAPSSTPVVNAGSNQTITLPSTASLSGTATGFPAGSTLTQTWSKVSGTGTVTFSSATALATIASFSTSGSYTLQLTVSGGGVSASGTTIITVNPAPSPTGTFAISTPLALDKTTVTAGQTLNATVTYKNTTASAVSVNNIVIAGRPPGGTNDTGPFLDFTPTTGATTIQPGATLQVLASRAFTSTDSTGKWYAYATYQDASGVWYDGPNAYFTVGSAPAPAPSSTPVVDAGPNQTITLPSTASLSGTATGFPAGSTLTQTWSKVSGTGTVTFSSATALATTASFSTSGAYTLQLTASGGGVSASGTTIITVNPVTSVTSGPVSYVSTTGNDSNSGSSSAPWRTIQKAANTVGAGATVNVSAGTYNERIKVTRSGASGSPITFQGQGTVLTHGFEITTNYIRVIGFDISTTTGGFPQGMGVYIFGAHNDILNNYIHNTCNEGIWAFGDSSRSSATTSFNTIQGNTIFRAQMTGIMVEGQNNVVDSNDISHTLQSPPGCGTSGDADGIRYFGVGHTIRKNHVHDILLSESPSAHIDATQTWGPAQNMIFEQNVFDIANDIIPGQTVGLGFTMESIDGQVDGLIIRNNVFINHYTGYGIDTQTGAGTLKNLTIVNNTFVRVDGFGTGGGGMAIWITPQVQNAIIKNNSFYDYGYDGDNYVRVTGGSGLDIGNNSITKSNGVAPSGSPYSGDLWMVDAKFVSVSARDFHLQSTSPLIDKALTLSTVTNDLDGTPRPQGPRPDVGACEYHP